MANVREAFLDEGVDEQVLQEMKTIWNNRLMASKAVEATPDPPQPSQAQPSLLANNPKTNGTKSKKAEQKAVGGSLNGNSKLNSTVPPLAAASKTIVTKREPTQQAATSQQSQVPTQPTIQEPADPNKLIPIQITLPPSVNETVNRVLTIKVPAIAIQHNTLQQAITGEIIASIMPLQTSVASAVLQQHVTSVLTAKGESCACRRHSVDSF